MKVFVTGGSGFLGKALCKKLKSLGYEVHSFSRSKCFELEEIGIITHQGDIAKIENLDKSIEKNIHCIFHVCSKTDMWGEYKDFYNTNILGTKNIIKQAKQKNIPYIVYTSSPSVIFQNSSIKGPSEQELDYPVHFNAYYPQTKSIAERMIKRANSSEPSKLKTISLRPHLIWGPADTSILPRLLKMAKNKKLKIIGNAKNKVDITYIDHAVMAHIQALQSLEKNPDIINGKAYFISDHNPVNLWDFINQMLKACNLEPITKKVPSKIIYAIACILEKYYTKKNIYSRWPAMTRFACLQLSQDHYFSHELAKKELEYKPWINIQEGLAKLKEYNEKI